MSLLALLLSTALAGTLPTDDVIPHREASISTLLHARLAPLGFSLRGLMAVLYMPPDEAIGCFLWEVRIIDLVTDTVLHTEKWDHDSCGAIIDRPTLMARKGKHFAALLDQHGITPAPATLTAFPVTSGTDTLSAHLITGPLTATEDGTLTAPVRVVVRSAQRGEKDIGTVYITAYPDMPLTWGHEVIGAIVSPHELRMVVIVREIRRGWEGLPYVESIHLMGASLEKGF